MWNSIRTRLTIIFIALTIGTLLITGIILSQRIFTADQSLAYNIQSNAAKDASIQVEAFLQEITDDLVALTDEVRSIQSNYGDENLNQQRSEMNASLSRAISTGPYKDAFEELAVLDGEGDEWAVLTHEENVLTYRLGNRKDLDEYIIPKSTRFTYYSPIQFDSTTGKPIITIAFPIFRGTQLKVVLVAKVRLEVLGGMLGDRVASEDQTIYITDSKGNLLVHQDPAVELQNSKITLPGQANTQIGLNGENVILATYEIPLGLFGEQSIFVVAEKPVDMALALSRNTRTTIVVLFIASILVSGLFGFLAIRSIVLPIEEKLKKGEAVEYF